MEAASDPYFKRRGKSCSIQLVTDIPHVNSAFRIASRKMDLNHDTFRAETDSNWEPRLLW